MASTLKVNTIQHTGGTSAVTIDSAGQVSFPNSHLHQQWQLTGDFGSDASTLTPFALSTISSQTTAMVGPSMSHSSGVFTFPKTGLYKVTLDLAMLTSGASQDNYANVRIELSTNSGGAFTTLKEVITGGIQNLASGHSGHVFINVTNASTFRVRFQTASLGSGSTVRGNAANSMAYTTVSFDILTDAQS